MGTLLQQEGVNQVSRTDTGLAERFAQREAERLLFDHSREQWFYLDGWLWRADRDGETSRRAIESARGLMAEAAYVPGLAEQREAARFATNALSEGAITRVLRLSSKMHPLTDDGSRWNTDPWLLGTANGVLDLRRGELTAGSPTQRISQAVAAPFQSDAECPRWTQFVHEICCSDPELVEFLQRAIGYTLTGDVSEQCLFLLYGNGANGKSTLLSVLERLMGGTNNYAFVLPFETLTGKRQQVYVRQLPGKRFVYAVEASERAKLDEGFLKSLTGGDPITARGLYESGITFNPQLKLWYAVNQLPRVEDGSEGFWRRMRAIPFERFFNESERDPRLVEKLIAESAGILRWAVDGCLDWQRQGLNPPADIKAATNEYRAESDPLAGFIADCCEQNPGLRTYGAVLFARYETYADARQLTGPERLGQKAFGSRMKARLPSKRDSGGIFYQGVGLLPVV